VAKINTDHGGGMNKKVGNKRRILPSKFVLSTKKSSACGPFFTFFSLHFPKVPLLHAGTSEIVFHAINTGDY